MSLVTVQTPLPVPAHHGAPPLQSFSETEQAAYDHVLAHFANPDYVLPGVDTEMASNLIEEECMWMSYECILRFLRTASYDPSKCIQCLEAVLTWRREFGLYTYLRPEHVEAESMSGSMFLYGYDSQRRPIICYYPSKQTTQEGEQQVQFFFWLLERTIELMGPGVETFAIMTDFAKAPSLYLISRVLDIMQTHYPERLGLSVAARSPLLFTTFWRFINPLMNAHTSSKLVFDSVSDEAGLSWRSARARDLCEPDAMLVSSDQRVSEYFSGSVQFEYNHEAYWPALLAMCEGRKKELARTWRQLGGVVGIREWDIKIGVQDG